MATKYLTDLVAAQQLGPSHRLTRAFGLGAVDRFLDVLCRDDDDTHHITEYPIPGSDF